VPLRAGWDHGRAPPERARPWRRGARPGVDIEQAGPCALGQDADTTGVVVSRLGQCLPEKLDHRSWVGRECRGQLEEDVRSLRSGRDIRQDLLEQRDRPSPVAGDRRPQANAQQASQTRRHGQRLAWLDPRLPAGELAADLEGEERVAGRRLLHSYQLRAGQIEIEPTAKQVIERAQIERTHGQPAQAGLGHAALHVDRDGEIGRSASRGQQANGLVTETSQRDLQHACGRRIQPLEVVDRDYDGLPCRQLVQRLEHGQADNEGIRRHFTWLLQQQRHLERLPAWRRQRAQRLRQHRSQQL
jgi:hypothetical protein